MLFFETTIALVAIAVFLALFARRIGAPYPAFLALAGVGLAFIPGAPKIELDADLALALFLAPVLVDSAFDMSLRDLRRDWPTIVSLVIGAVVATTVVVAFIARWFVPQMPWSVAIALGALVAPPDAVAASAVMRFVNPPRRLVTILEGESLFNDASALVIFRGALIAATSTLPAAKILPPLVAAVPLSFLAGYLLAQIVPRLLRRVNDMPSAILLQFVVSFGIWLAAERVHLSGVLTLVTFAATTARNDKTPARLRLPSFAIWETAIFFLNILAFTIIGLQIGPVMENLDAQQRLLFFKIGAATLVAVIVVRFVWVFLNGAGVSFLAKLRGYSPINPAVRPGWRGAVVVSWSGMRGIVTLAGALALPLEFPYRDLIVFCAFFVVLGTLVLQGFTLGPLLRALELPQDRQLENETGFARTEALRAAMACLDGDEGEAAARLREEYSAMLAIADEGPETYAPAVSEDGRLRLKSLAASRARLSELRRNGEIGDIAFHRVEEELDRTELGVTSVES
ncbi:MAG: sodium:proton antiporter [Hyphomicrobiales bacterium]|nr:sodium:proton antiporter [Hyphomicrobiales bacterium]